jgi:hypothetical protein
MKIFFFFFVNRRFGFKIEREYIDASILYSFQVVLTILLACEPTLLYATESTALAQAQVNNCSYQINKIFVFVQ